MAQGARDWRVAGQKVGGDQGNPTAGRDRVSSITRVRDGRTITGSGGLPGGGGLRPDASGYTGATFAAAKVRGAGEEG